MIYFGLSVTTILGLCVALSISQRLKIVEALGLAFLMGIGIQTFLMVCMDWVGIRLTATSALTCSGLVIAGLCVSLYFRWASVKEWLRYVSAFTRPKISWLWVLALLAIAVVVVMNVAKTMYYPTFDTDSVRGFNLIGKVVAHDGTLKNCGLYTDANYAEMRGSVSTMTYMPLTQLAYTYVYLLGAATSKIINALLFISFTLVFYGLMSRFATHTLAAIATFLTLITPEMLGFSSMSGVNVIHAFYASLGIIFFATWYYKKIPSLLWIAACMLMLNSWSRTEGIVFIGAAGCVFLWYSIKTKQYKTLLLLAGCGLLPIIFWNVFLKVNHMEGVQSVVAKLFWDGEKVSIIMKEMWILFKSNTFYGITFVAFIIVLASNGWMIFKKYDQVVTLILIGLSWLFYTILIYQVDYIWDSLENVMRYSYKRFLFSFVPLLWFYIASSHNVKWLFDKVDAFLFPLKKQA
ncbi:MAG: hypothetical protein LBJ57_02950 [Prevotellaceae bacterium]|jgi:hypothetical protein|nr:hypothetical protein [Prevotellaceae bacterium]